MTSFRDCVFALYRKTIVIGSSYYIAQFAEKCSSTQAILGGKLANIPESEESYPQNNNKIWQVILKILKYLAKFLTKVYTYIPNSRGKNQ